MTERTSTTIWEGGLTDGSGSFTVGSGAFGPQDVSWARRTEEPKAPPAPKSSSPPPMPPATPWPSPTPCHEQGTPPQHLEVTSKVGFGPKEGGGMQVTYSKLSVKGKVDGLTSEQFAELAKAGEAGCPVSNALRNNVKIELESTLE